jgi:hypothetical protein
MSNFDDQPTHIIRVRGRVSEERAARIRHAAEAAALAEARRAAADPLSPARGCLTGMLLALTIYVLLALIVVLIYLGVN